MAVGRWFFQVNVDYGMRWGRVWAADDAAAVSIWLPPGSRWSSLRSLRVGMAAFPFRVGPKPMLDIMRFAPALERLHRSVRGPHWYLMAIGTRPSRQGEGLGSALLTPGYVASGPCGAALLPRDVYSERCRLLCQARVRGCWPGRPQRAHPVRNDAAPSGHICLLSHGNIERRAHADVRSVFPQPSLGGEAALVPQPAEKVPMGRRLRRGAEFDRALAGDPV